MDDGLEAIHKDSAFTLRLSSYFPRRAGALAGAPLRRAQGLWDLHTAVSGNCRPLHPLTAMIGWEQEPHAGVILQGAIRQAGSANLYIYCHRDGQIGSSARGYASIHIRSFLYGLFASSGCRGCDAAS